MPNSAYADGGRLAFSVDAAGFQRDNLRRVTHKAVAMQTCFEFVGRQRNQSFTFSPDGRKRFRLIDAVNWQMADLLQYVDDQLAAELRQVQRMLAIVSAGQLALEVFYGFKESDATILNTEVGDVHVKRAAYTLLLAYASIGVAFRAMDPVGVPPIPDSLDVEFDNKLFCKLFAPAFVHLLDNPSALAHTTAAQQQEASLLGLMRATLLWKDASRIAKGTVTRSLSSGAAQHAAWSALPSEVPKKRTVWCEANVVIRLTGRGIGSWTQGAEGWGYNKPTREQLDEPALKQLLNTRLQLSTDEIIATLPDPTRGVRRARDGVAPFGGLHAAVPVAGLSAAAHADEHPARRQRPLTQPFASVPWWKRSRLQRRASKQG